MRHIETITEYNDLRGVKTMHPLVGFIDSMVTPKQIEGQVVLGFYSLFLKETKGCVINYGITQYDFDAETVVAFAPGQAVGYAHIEGVPPKAIGILFHPTLLIGTSLEKKMQQYSYFAYESNEALHLSEDEVQVLRHSMEFIRTELQHPIDKYSQQLIITNIELILDYCLRFYERQFITRKTLNMRVLNRFNELLSDYLVSHQGATDGVPSVKYFADKACLSANYFGDLVKAETGVSAQEYIAQRMICFAQRQLLDTTQSIKQIAGDIGFQHPQHFVRFFKRRTRQTPAEYRNNHQQ